MDEQFKWTPFYMEFADKLKEYANKRSELIGEIQKIYQTLNMKLPTLEKKGSPVVDIDPFTVFGLFNKGISDANRIAIASEFAKVFSVTAEVPDSFKGIPVLNNMKATFYWFKDERGEEDIENLWKTFLAALEFADNNTMETRENFCKIYDTVIQQLGIKWNLSIGLYWVRPYTYLSLDSRNKMFFKSVPIPDFKEILSDRLSSVPDSDTYLSICENVKKLIETSDVPYSDFPSLSQYAWEYTNDKWFSSIEEYDTDHTNGIMPDNLKEDILPASNSEFLKYFAPLIQALKELGGSATRKDAHEKVVELMGISEEELSVTYEKTGASRVLNQIDFARNDLAHEGFISSGTKGIWALTELGTSIEMTPELAGLIHMKWVKINTAKRKGEPIPDIDLSKYYKKKVDHKYTKDNFLKDVFITEPEYDKLRSLLLKKKNIILQGAPGVGKTFSAKRLAYSIIGEKNENRICMVQFHQNYSYEDFIMGYRPAEDGSFELRSGVFYNFCERCKENPDKPYFFIIDEINRGNLSKIFGELLMLIETDKRGEEHRINLVYGGTSFYIPDNLHIIGMMNTADRSLAMIDYALRRRFSFYTMKPAFENADNNGFGDYMKQIDSKLYHTAVSKIRELNSVIRNDSSLGKGFEIGHSYFAPEDISVIDDAWVCNVIEYEIIPMIEEYWFDDDKKTADWTKALYQLIGEEYDG